MLFHVTGANGIVGKEVIRALEQIGDVHATDVQDMDVTDSESVKKVFNAHPPDAVIHLAGLKGNLPSREDPLKFFNVNMSGTLNLLEASRHLNVGHFVFFSSLTVHGPTAEAINERSPLFPLHPYSGSKGASENIVHAYSNAYGINSTIFRPNFIVTAIPEPQPYVDNLIYDFIRLALDPGVITLAGDGQFEREWMHPSDVASAVAAAVTANRSGCETYILRGERVTMEQFARRIVAKVGKGEVITNPDMGGFSIISSGEKAEKELDWKPKVDLDGLISMIWEEYQVRHGR